MAILEIALFPAVLLVLSVALIWRHVVVWREMQLEDLEPGQLRFFRQQFRRRVQASAMLGLLGVGLLIQQLIPGKEQPMLWTISLLIILGLLLWVVLLALVDLWHTRFQARRLDQHAMVETAKMRAEIERELAKQASGANGHTNGFTPPRNEQN